MEDPDIMASIVTQGLLAIGYPFRVIQGMTTGDAHREFVVQEALRELAAERQEEAAWMQRSMAESAQILGGQGAGIMGRRGAVGGGVLG